MFNFKPNPTFTAEVPLGVPGEPSPQLVTMTFRHVPASKLGAMFDPKNGLSTVAAVLSILESWDMKSDGEPVALNEKNLTALFDNYPASAVEIVIFYRRELTEAKLKN